MYRGIREDDEEIQRHQSETSCAPTATAKAKDKKTSIDPLAQGSRLEKAWAAAWASLCTFRGFILMVYAVNVIAWGGMLFLLLCTAVPTMCHPDCDDIYSSRRIWIDINSRILTTLMAAPAFLMAPVRLRNLYHMIRYRLWKETEYLSLLVAAHDAWFQGEPSTELRIDLNHRQSPLWKLECVVCAAFANTAAYVVVVMVFMWCFSRFNRPIWSAPTFVAIALSTMLVTKLCQRSEMRKRRRFA